MLQSLGFQTVWHDLATEQQLKSMWDYLAVHAYSLFFHCQQTPIFLFTRFSHHFLREAFLNCSPHAEPPTMFSDGTVYLFLVACDCIELFLFCFWAYLITVPHSAKLSDHQRRPSSHLAPSCIPSRQHSACHFVGTQHILYLLKEAGKRKIYIYKFFKKIIIKRIFFLISAVWVEAGGWCNGNYSNHHKALINLYVFFWTYHTHILKWKLYRKFNMHFIPR